MQRYEIAALKKALINMFAPCKEQVLSITSDNGREFFEHQAIAKKLASKYYFAHPNFAFSW